MRIKVITVRNNVKKFREEKGYSLNRLAREAGISPSVLFNIENGKKLPKINTALKLSKVMRRTVNSMFKLEERFVHPGKGEVYSGYEPDSSEESPLETTL